MRSRLEDEAALLRARGRCQTGELFYQIIELGDVVVGVLVACGRVEIGNELRRLVGRYFFGGALT